MLTGAYTALITPYTDDAVDVGGLEKLVEFQIENGIDGILAVGTTGESPVLTWEEHDAVIERVAKLCAKRCTCVAGTGSNSTREAIHASEHAARAGAAGVLLVDPYYNGPSSLEIRKEYIEPVARRLPGIEIIPYIIPGRTGCQMLPEDLALLHAAHPNVSTVKEASGDLLNMKRTRACCGDGMSILSGDDGLTVQMMTDPAIQAAGLISVVSNVAPGPVGRMVRFLREGRLEEARRLESALLPLFGLVTVKTTETTPHGDVVCRARNPLGIKTLMNIMGMPAGRCRPPLGKMTPKGLSVVLEAARTVWRNNPDILEPMARFFGVDIESRLNTPANWEHLAYTGY